MAYKDRTRQRDADRERQRRHRQGVTEGVTEGVTKGVTTIDPAVAIPNYGLPDCQCKHCQNNRNSGYKYILNHGPYKKLSELGTREYNRVSLPGDPDYIRPDYIRKLDAVKGYVIDAMPYSTKTPHPPQGGGLQVR